MRWRKREETGERERKELEQRKKEGERESTLTFALSLYRENQKREGG